MGFKIVTVLTVFNMNGFGTGSLSLSVVLLFIADHLNMQVPIGFRKIILG